MTAAPTHALFKIALDFLRDVRKLSSKVHTFKKLRIYRCIYLFIKQFQHDILIVGSERILRIFLATIVGLVFAIILVIVCCCFKVRREQVIIHELTTLFKKKISLIVFSQFSQRMRKQLIEAGLMHFEEGAPECLNPDLTVDDQADLLPYDRKWEFPRDKLKLGEKSFSTSKKFFITSVYEIFFSYRQTVGKWSFRSSDESSSLWNHSR